MSHVVNNTTANNMRAAGGLRGDISNEFEGLSERLPLSSKFDTARDEDAYEKVRTRLEREGRTAEGQPSLADQVRGLQMGTLDVKDVSNANALGAAGQHILLKEKLKADRERATSDALFYALLDQLRDMVEANESYFSSEYGPDYINTMAELYLDENEREGLKTEDDLQQALFDKYLNADGSIKDEYKGTKVGEDIHKLYETEQARKLGLDIKENGLTEENKKRVEKVFEGNNFYASSIMTAESDNKNIEDRNDAHAEQSTISVMQFDINAIV